VYTLDYVHASKASISTKKCVDLISEICSVAYAIWPETYWVLLRAMKFSHIYNYTYISKQECKCASSHTTLHTLRGGDLIPASHVPLGHSGYNIQTHPTHSGRNLDSLELLPSVKRKTNQPSVLSGNIVTNDNYNPDYVCVGCMSPHPVSSISSPCSWGEGFLEVRSCVRWRGMCECVQYTTPLYISWH